MARKILPLILTSMLAIAPKANAENRAYALIGSSSNTSNPVHGSLGATLSKDIVANFEFGLDLNLLVERTNYELNGGLSLDRKLNNKSLGMGIGMSKIHFKNPLYVSDEPISEPIPGIAFYFTPHFSMKIHGKSRLKVIYRRNFTSEDIFNHSYPSDRFSAGLETSF